MPLNLGDVSKAPTKQKRSAPKAANDAAVKLGVDLSSSPDKHVVKAGSQVIEVKNIAVPYRIGPYVIFSKAGGVSMKHCGSEEKAKEFVERLESGYVGN